MRNHVYLLLTLVGRERGEGRGDRLVYVYVSWFVKRYSTAIVVVWYGIYALSVCLCLETLGSIFIA